MLESVVAMAVFAIFCATSAGLLLSLTDSTRSSLRRTVATNLATQAVQVVRAGSALDVPDGRIVRDVPVGGTTYTMTQTSSFLSDDQGVDVCSSSGTGVAYRLVTVVVSWPDAGISSPVRLSTLRSSGAGRDGTTGILAVKVSGSDGSGRANLPLTLTPGGRTATTDANGCAVFTRLAPATYSVAAEEAGWVGPLNVRRASAAGLAVTVDRVRRGTLLYDRNRTAPLKLEHPATDAVVPAGLVVRSGDTYVPETTYPACADPLNPVDACVTRPTTGIDGTLAGFFPEIYDVVAGSCLETRRSQTTADLRGTGELPTVAVPVGGAVVTVKNALGAELADRPLTFRHAAQTSGCTSGETLTSTTVAGGSTVLLPYGTWTVSTPVSPLTPTVVVSATVTVTPTARTVARTLTVLL